MNHMCLARLCCAAAAGCCEVTEPIAQLSPHQLIAIGQTEAAWLWFCSWQACVYILCRGCCIRHKLACDADLCVANKGDKSTHTLNDVMACWCCRLTSPGRMSSGRCLSHCIDIAMAHRQALLCVAVLWVILRCVYGHFLYLADCSVLINLGC